MYRTGNEIISQTFKYVDKDGNTILEDIPLKGFH